jgi:hypothetical protein
MSALFNPPSTPTLPPAPAPPQLTDPAVQSRADEERRARQAVGRASQFMTTPQHQLDAGPSRRAELGGT